MTRECKCSNRGLLTNLAAHHFSCDTSDCYEKVRFQHADQSCSHSFQLWRFGCYQKVCFQHVSSAEVPTGRFWTFIFMTERDCRLVRKSPYITFHKKNRNDTSTQSVELKNKSEAGQARKEVGLPWWNIRWISTKLSRPRFFANFFNFLALATLRQ